MVSELRSLQAQNDGIAASLRSLLTQVTTALGFGDEDDAIFGSEANFV
ncbi:hypothetical protein IAD21_03120 [Abditibacteriota bacterium]|nr:hypothetical protein IAD21_03120 [Abditibacteriota bacterium]